MLDVVYDGTTLTTVAGVMTQVEAGTANSLCTDTLSYIGTSATVTVDLTAGTASGFTTIATIENVDRRDGRAPYGQCRGQRPQGRGAMTCSATARAMTRSTAE